MIKSLFKLVGGLSAVPRLPPFILDIYWRIWKKSENLNMYKDVDVSEKLLPFLHGCSSKLLSIETHWGVFESTSQILRHPPHLHSVVKCRVATLLWAGNNYVEQIIVRSEIKRNWSSLIQVKCQKAEKIGGLHFLMATVLSSANSEQNDIQDSWKKA